MANNDEFSSFTDERLAILFRDICVKQSANRELGKHKRYNQLYGKMDAVLVALKARSGDQRRALAEFYHHENAQVRLMAAIFTLAIFPVEARAALQKISDDNEYPQAANARGILRGMDDGTYMPD